MTTRALRVSDSAGPTWRRPTAVTLRPATPPLSVRATEQVTLCEALDRVLNKGAVVVGEITISVADIDLIYLGLQAVLTSIETARTLTGPARAPIDHVVEGAVHGVR